jgi:hypothetical protein
MNLAQIEGDFDTPLNLLKTTIKLYLQYDYELETEDILSLTYGTKTGEITIRLKQTISDVIMTIGDAILKWKLSTLIQEEVEFPLSIRKGEAKTVFVKENLSKQLIEVKQIMEEVSQAGTKPKSPQEQDSPSKKPKKEQITQPNQKANVESNRERASAAIQSPRLQSSNSFLYPSGVIPHGGGIPERPYRPPVAPMTPRFGVGEADLNPFGSTPGIVRPSPMHPGGGMIVGPDHPMFQAPSRPHGGGPMGPPPGARFDPVMPFGPGGGRPMRPPGRPHQPPFRFPILM